MSGEKLPEGWVEAPLSSVTTLIRGVTYKKEQAINYRKDDYFPIIRANNIQNGQFDITDLVFVPRNLVKESQKISPEDIVIAMSSGSKSVVGKSAHQRLPFTCSFGAFCGVLRPEKPIYPSFIAHFTKSSFYRNKISSLSAGANINNIKPASFDLVNIPIPSHVEQILIVKKLDMLLAQVDNTKGRLEKIPQILKRFRQAVLAAAVSGNLTDTWRVHNSFNFPLQKYYDLIKEKKLKAKNTSEPCEEKTWLRCNLGHIFNVKSGDGLTAKEMNTSGDIAVYGGNGITGYHDRYNTEEPSIVIGRVGYYCGSVHLTSKRSWITDNALLVDFHSGMIEKKFAYWLLKGTNLRVNISSSAQPVISGAKIYSIEIVIPPIEEQAEIVRRVEQLFAYADTIEKQVNSALDRVNNLTQSILAKAFRGELTAQWRAENPDLISGENSAAALLEKIKAERAASGSKKASRKKT